MSFRLPPNHCDRNEMGIHHFNNMRLNISHLFFIFAGFFLLSFVTFLIPQLNPLFFVLCLLFFVVLTLRNLEYGVYIFLGDLFTTSFGYLFQWQGVSLRIGMVVIFFSILLYRIFQRIFQKVLLPASPINSDNLSDSKSYPNSKSPAEFDHQIQKQNDKYQKLISPPRNYFNLLSLGEFVRNQKLLTATYCTLLIWISFSFIRGWFVHGFSTSFLDADRYFYLIFLAIIPALKVEKEEVFVILKAGLLWMFVFVSFIEIVFAWFGENEILYKFVRDFRFGEITPFVGNYWRIFLQSEVYAVIGLLLGIAYIFARPLSDVIPEFIGDPENKNKHKTKLGYGLVFVNAVILILSLSRSFWLGTGVAIICLTVFCIRHSMLDMESRRQKQTINKSFSFLFSFWIPAFARMTKRIWKQKLKVVLVFAMSIIYTLLISNTWLGAGKVAGSRIDASEPAASSRSAQLVPLIDGIKNSPLIGYGFGKQLEYVSSDPRVKKSTAGETGRISTYAFELGWLDLWLKMGVIGVVGYGMVLTLVIRMLYQTFRASNDLFSLSMVLSLIALVVIHLFTPYLNHALGIGFLMIAFIVLSDKIRPVHL